MSKSPWQRLVSFVHRKVQEAELKKHVPWKHKRLNSALRAALAKGGAGVYYMNIWSRQNTGSAKLIAAFSDGITHSIPVVYSEDLRSMFTQAQWDRIRESWRLAYGSEIDGDVVAIGLPTAETIGMVVCDVSKYMNRRFTLRKVRGGDQGKMIEYYVGTLGAPYDFVGLLAWFVQWLLRAVRIRDDLYAWFCSEVTAAGAAAGGVRLSRKRKPSPGELEEEGPAEWIVARGEG